MLISIIIPIYKVEQYIISCLNSIVTQSYDNIECILVDDKTPDKSIELAASFISKYRGKISFKILLHSTNLGLSAARNTGVSAAKGEYVFFLDSDDELMPQAIQLMLDKIAYYGKVDFLVGGIKVEGSNICYPIKSNEYLSTNVQVLINFLRGSYYVMACGKFIKRSFLEKYSIRFVDGMFHEDILYSFLLAYYAENAVVTSQKMYLYKIRNSESISSALGRKNFVDIFHSLSIRLRMLQDFVGLDERKKKAYTLKSCFLILPLLYKSQKLIGTQDCIAFDRKVKEILRQYFIQRKWFILTPLLLFCFFPYRIKRILFSVYYNLKSAI